MSAVLTADLLSAELFGPITSESFANLSLSSRAIVLLVITSCSNGLNVEKNLVLGALRLRAFAAVAVSVAAEPKTQPRSGTAWSLEFGSRSDRMQWRADRGPNCCIAREASSVELCRYLCTSNLVRSGSHPDGMCVSAWKLRQVEFSVYKPAFCIGCGGVVWTTSTLKSVIDPA